MDRRSWLWRRKSSEKGTGETESSGSGSSYSERCSDDQDALRASPNNSSPNHSQSAEVSSHDTSSDVHETVKSLTEKLSAALLNISAKENLVKQHMRVAEEAVSGWEKAGTELAGLKQQLEAASQKNSAFEDRIGHLDEALKESVRQLRHSREEQEQKIHDALMKKTREWESVKFELQNRLIEYQIQLESVTGESTLFYDHDLQSKLEAAEKENRALKVELLALSEDLQMRTLEKELSTRAAETASKQHLESIKKLVKLEAECRRLRALARRTSSANDHKPANFPVYVESLTDSQSDSGERIFCDNDPSCSDSWASALIAELDQFKNDKASARKLASSSEIDPMDDFLEMERLAAMPEPDRGNSSVDLEAEPNCVLPREDPLKTELEALHRQMVEWEHKVEKLETEKSELEMALDNTRNRLELSSDQLIEAKDKLILLQRYLDSANESKLISIREVVFAEENGKALESRLESAQLEVGKLRERVGILQGQIEKEKAVSGEFEAEVEATKKELECQLESANCKVKKLHERVYSLENKLETEKAVSTESTLKLEEVEGSRKALEFQLELANSEVNKLHKKFEERTVSAEFCKALECQLEAANCKVKKLQERLRSLEDKLEKEKSVATEFAIKVEVMEGARKTVESQLELANSEVKKLHEKVEEERTVSAESASKLESFEGTRKAMECQIESAHLEVEKLNEMVALLEDKILEHSSLSAKFTTELEASEAARKVLEAQLHSAHMEVGKLRDLVALLEEKVEEAKALSTKPNANFENLEDDHSKKKQERVTNSNPELKIKQEEELASAAGKLAECQKTIASLGRQLKLLSSFDDFMLEDEKLEQNGGSENLANGDIKKLQPIDPLKCVVGNTAIPNGNEGGAHHLLHLHPQHCLDFEV